MYFNIDINIDIFKYFNIEFSLSYRRGEWKKIVGFMLIYTDLSSLLFWLNLLILYVHLIDHFFLNLLLNLVFRSFNGTCDSWSYSTRCKWSWFYPESSSSWWCQQTCSIWGITFVQKSNFIENLNWLDNGKCCWIFICYNLEWSCRTDALSSTRRSNERSFHNSK